MQTCHKEQLSAPFVLCHINDLRITCDHVKYGDDCTIWEACSHSCAHSSFKTAADEMAEWTTTNKIELNYDKQRKCDKRHTHWTSNCTRLLDVAVSRDLTRIKNIFEACDAIAIARQPTLADRTQTLCRCSRACSNPITSCDISLPPRHVTRVCVPSFTYS